MATPFDARRLCFVLHGSGTATQMFPGSLANVTGGVTLDLVSALKNGHEPDSDFASYDRFLGGLARAFEPLPANGLVVAPLCLPHLMALGHDLDEGSPNLVSALARSRMPVVHLLSRDVLTAAILSCLRKDKTLPGAGTSLWLDPEIVAAEAQFLRDQQALARSTLKRAGVRVLEVVEDDLHDARLALHMRRVLMFVGEFAPVPNDIRLPQDDLGINRIANLLELLETLGDQMPDALPGLPPPSVA